MTLWSSAVVSAASVARRLFLFLSPSLSPVSASFFVLRSFSRSFPSLPLLLLSFLRRPNLAPSRGKTHVGAVCVAPLLCILHNSPPGALPPRPSPAVLAVAGLSHATRVAPPLCFVVNRPRLSWMNRQTNPSGQRRNEIELLVDCCFPFHFARWLRLSPVRFSSFDEFMLPRTNRPLFSAPAGKN